MRIAVTADQAWKLREWGVTSVLKPLFKVRGIGTVLSANILDNTSDGRIIELWSPGFVTGLYEEDKVVAGCPYGSVGQVLWVQEPRTLDGRKRTAVTMSRRDSGMSAEVESISVVVAPWKRRSMRGHLSWKIELRRHG